MSKRMPAASSMRRKDHKAALQCPKPHVRLHDVHHSTSTSTARSTPNWRPEPRLRYQYQPRAAFRLLYVTYQWDAHHEECERLRDMLGYTDAEAEAAARNRGETDPYTAPRSVVLGIRQVPVGRSLQMVLRDLLGRLTEPDRDTFLSYSLWLEELGEDEEEEDEDDEGGEAKEGEDETETEGSGEEEDEGEETDAEEGEGQLSVGGRSVTVRCIGYDVPFTHPLRTYARIRIEVAETELEQVRFAWEMHQYNTGAGQFRPPVSLDYEGVDPINGLAFGTASGSNANGIPAHRRGRNGPVLDWKRSDNRPDHLVVLRFGHETALVNRFAAMGHADDDDPRSRTDLGRAFAERILAYAGMEARSYFRQLRDQLEEADPFECIDVCPLPPSPPVSPTV